jgi:hypothetical protein
VSRRCGIGIPATDAGLEGATGFLVEQESTVSISFCPYNEDRTIRSAWRQRKAREAVIDNLLFEENLSGRKGVVDFGTRTSLSNKTGPGSGNRPQRTTENSY